MFRDFHVIILIASQRYHLSAIISDELHGKLFEHNESISNKGHGFGIF